MYKKVPEYYEAYDLLMQKPDFYIEMTRKEGGILCGMIQKYRPHKIYELGVAAGGSTCLLLKCLDLLGLEDTTLCSIDLADRYYRDNAKETGYLLKDNKNEFRNYEKQKFRLGKYAVQWIQEITGNIDFLFLDTTHRVPGEILDFLLLYPYLSINGIVVLHDTNLHNLEVERDSFCTRVLFNTVVADKYYASAPESLNIGAFQITDDTKKYIGDIFASLLLPWCYNVDKSILKSYRNEYQKHYSDELLTIFDNAVKCAEWRLRMDKNMNREREEMVNVNLSFTNVLERARKAETVMIVGAGIRGKELLCKLETDDSVSIKGFLDNNDEQDGGSIKGVKIAKPYKVDGYSCVYIIAVDSAESRRELKAQLRKLGIEEKEITFYCVQKDYDYYSSLNEKYYKQEIQSMYYEHFGKAMNWENPATYNEIINWEKLNVKDERRTRLADKYLVREWVKEQIGEEYLTKLYGVWESADDIDFNALPQAFVLKLNNGSSRNIIVKDKSGIIEKEVRHKLNKWRDTNFAYLNLELHYRDIVPMIICEEYLEGLAESVYDYNVYCFHGEPEYIWCIKGSHKPDCQATFYDKNWIRQEFSYGYPKDPTPAPKPANLDKMLELSRKLSSGFEHVRVDWYCFPDGRILFSEMTFSTWGGLSQWEPEEWDTIFGKLILDKRIKK